MNNSETNQNDLVGCAEQHVLTALADGAWRSVTELCAVIPVELAEAQAATTSPDVYVHSGAAAFGQSRLTQDVLKSLQSAGRCATRTFNGKQEVRLTSPEASSTRGAANTDSTASKATTNASGKTFAKKKATPAQNGKGGADAGAAALHAAASAPKAPSTHSEPPRTDSHRADAAAADAVATATPAQTGPVTPPSYLKMPIEQIRVEGRHRKNLGDIDSLAASIQRLGLLHPLILTLAGVLIAGLRRLHACKKLGWQEVPVIVVAHLEDAVQLLEAERDENQCRKDLDLSEAVALGHAVEAVERDQAKERQRLHGGTAPGRSTNTGEKFAPVSAKGKTRDKVAKVVGMSGVSYEKAKAVVEAMQSRKSSTHNSSSPRK